MAITHSSGTITIDSGRTASTATSGGTATLTDTGQSWTTNAEAGYILYIHAGTGSGQYALIASNTATVLTITRSWSYNFTTGAITVTASDWGTTPDNTSQYVILYQWSDVQAADTTGGWGVVTTQGDQIRIAGDIQWGGGTNYGGLWDYNKYVEVQWPSAGPTYSVLRWVMSDNVIWGDGLIDDNGEPTDGGVYHFDAANVNTTGIDLFNDFFVNYSFHLNMFDTVWKASRYNASQSYIFARMKSNSSSVMLGFESSNGPAGRWASDNTIVNGALLHDCVNDWALTGSPALAPTDVVVYNADAGAQVSDPGAEYDNWVWYNNNDVISMGGFTTGNNFYITDSYMAKDKSVGLLQQSDISCSSSLGNAAAAGALYERKSVSYNVVDSSGTAINGARVYLENTSGTQQFNVTTDSNGDTTVTKVNVQLWQGSSNPGVNNVPPNAATVYNPMTLRIRDYDYNFLEETFTLEFPVVLQSKALADNPFVVASQATAAAYTGISVNHGTGAVTITADHTIQELYDYSINDLCASGNIQYDQWLTTADGINFTSTYDITVTGSGIDLTSSTQNISFSGGAALTVASGAFYEDTNGAIWESGGSVYYASHFYHRVLISGTSTAIQNAVVGYYASGTNYTYNTSLSNTTLTSDASGDVEGYVVYQIDASPVTGHSLLCREYDYDLFSSPATIDGNPIGASGSPVSISLVADSNVSASRATASAYSGITINHGSSTLGIATSDRTVQELYDYNKYNITLAANFDQSEWLTTTDGVNYTVGYATTVTGVDLTDEAASLTFSVSLTVASGGFFEDSNGARWESGGSTYYATHIRHRVVISGTSTAIQNAVVAYYETDTTTNQTYDTSLSSGALTTDASGDVEGYAVYRIDAATFGGHNLLVREYDYNLFSSPATVDGNPIGSSGSPNQVSLVTDSFISASRATAAAYTGITITHGSTSLAIASTSRTIQQIYDYNKYDITLAANFNRSAWLTTADGTNFIFGYNTTVTGVNLAEEAKFVTFSGTLTLASGGFFEDGDNSRWESGGAIYYASHIRHRVLISGTSTAIQNAVVAYYASSTNYTYNTSLSNTALTSDASGDVEGYVVHQIDATPVTGHALLCREYDYDLFSSPATIDGNPIGASGSPVSISLVADSFVSAARATAAAYTGITINHGTPSLAIATSARTIQELYDYTKYDITLAANFANSQWFTTVDGSTFTTTYNTTVTGVNFTGLSNTFALSSATLTLASGGFFEDSTRAQWESGGSIYYASHFYIEANLDGTATSIQNAVVSYYETDGDTNVTYNTSLTQTGLISDANGQVEGYAVYRVDSTTYGGHNLLIGSYDHQWINIPAALNGTPVGSSGTYNIFYMRVDANVTDTRTNALAVSGVTVTYGSNLVVTTAAASDTYDNLKARQTRYTDIDTGTPGVDSYYEVSLYNGGDGHILAHSGTAHVLADTWDFSIASDYGYPLSFDSSTLSLTATGSYQDLTFTGNATVEFEAVGTYTLATNITLTGLTTFDNLTAGTVNVTMAPGATTPTLANTGGGGNPVISNDLVADISITGLVNAAGADRRLQIINSTATSASAWQASTAYSAGDMVLRSTGVGTESTAGLYMRCTTAGTSGGTEPTWSTTVGNTTTDNTVTWTTYAVLYYDSDPAATSFADTYVVGEEFDTGETYEVRFAEMDSSTSFKTYQTTGLVASSGFSLAASMTADSVFAANGLYGADYEATFSPNYTSNYLVMDANIDFSVLEAYAYFCYTLTSSQGMYLFWGGVTAIDVGNYRNNTSVLSLYFDESAGFVKQTDSARWFRSDGARPALDPTTGGNGIEINWRNPVYIAETGVSGLTGSESAQLLSLPSASAVADAVWDEDLSTHTTPGTSGEILQKTQEAAEGIHIE